MTIAAFAVSLLALLIALGSLWYTHRANQRADRGDHPAHRGPCQARPVLRSVGTDQDLMVLDRPSPDSRGRDFFHS